MLWKYENCQTLAIVKSTLRENLYVHGITVGGTIMYSGFYQGGKFVINLPLPTSQGTSFHKSLSRVLSDECL